MILRRKAVAPTHEWEAVVEDSVPELDEAVEVTTPAVGAEEDVVEDSAPELDEADEVSPPAVGAEEDVEDSAPELD